MAGVTLVLHRLLVVVVTGGRGRERADDGGRQRVAGRILDAAGAADHVDGIGRAAGQRELAGVSVTVLLAALYATVAATAAPPLDR